MLWTHERQEGVVLPQDRRITVLCVDDHPIVREGIVSIVEGDSDLQIVGEAETAQQAIAAFHTWKPDVTVIDLRLPDRDGVEVIREIRKDFPKSLFVVLTSAEGDIDMRRALEAGAQAYLIKGVVRTELRQVIKAVYSGQRQVPANVAEKIAAHLNEPILTARELEVLQLVADGMRNKEVAARLSIAEDTVKMHLRNVMQKLEVNDRTHAVMVAVRRGFIRP
jgi:DNA-binding NarL/FixJ family response regulator